MSIEAGARCGIVAPDEATFAYLKGGPLAEGRKRSTRPSKNGRRCSPIVGATFDQDVR